MFFNKNVKFVIGLLIAMAISGCTIDDRVDFPTQPLTIVEDDEVTLNRVINDDMKTVNLKEEIIKLCNNDTSADELITTVYKEEELKSFVKLSTVLKERPPECVRYSQNKLYLIYKYERNNYLFLMYDLIEDDSFPIASWYVGKKMFCNDFEALANKKASFNEVREFDPHGNYTAFYTSSSTSLYSLHYTIDGYLIRLDYTSNIGEPLKISEITKFDGEDNLICNNLLSIDKELITP